VFPIRTWLLELNGGTALCPMITLLLPKIIFDPAPVPIAVLKPPPITLSNVFVPTDTFSSPIVL
jgi:hypothetical protein